MEKDSKRSGVGEEVREGIRAGLGILGAMKDAIEETFEEFLDTDRHRSGEENRATDDEDEGLEDTAQRAREAAREAARSAADRLDVPSRTELDELRTAIDALRARVEALEARGDAGS